MKKKLLLPLYIQKSLKMEKILKKVKVVSQHKLKKWKEVFKNKMILCLMEFQKDLKYYILMLILT